MHTIWARTFVQSKVLKENNLQFILQKRSLQKSSSELHVRIKLLQKKRKGFNLKCEGLEKLVLKFSKRQDNLDKLSGSQRMSFNKEGIRYNPFTKKKESKNFFIQETSKS